MDPPLMVGVNVVEFMDVPLVAQRLVKLRVCCVLGNGVLSLSQSFTNGAGSAFP